MGSELLWIAGSALALKFFGSKKDPVDQLPEEKQNNGLIYQETVFSWLQITGNRSLLQTLRTQDAVINAVMGYVDNLYNMKNLQAQAAWTLTKLDKYNIIKAEVEKIPALVALWKPVVIPDNINPNQIPGINYDEVVRFRLVMSSGGLLHSQNPQIETAINSYRALVASMVNGEWSNNILSTAYGQDDSTQGMVAALLYIYDNAQPWVGGRGASMLTQQIKDEIIAEEFKFSGLPGVISNEFDGKGFDWLGVVKIVTDAYKIIREIRNSNQG